MASILVLHGPNLNLLGTREPEIYGSETLDEINHRLQSEAERAGASLTSVQSNSEQELIETIHQARAEIGRAHVRTPVTEKSRMPSSA